MMKQNHEVSNVPEGYKQTEVGIIPEDWELLALYEMAQANGLVRGPFGGALKKEIFIDRGYKVYEQRNAIYSTTELGSYFIDECKFNELNRFSITPGDFIISCSGTIGRIYQLPIDAPRGIINQALLKVSLRNDINHIYFLKYFKWNKFQEKIIDGTQGGAMKNLVGMDEFRNSLMAIPKTLKEQIAIANALSDVDALIAELEKLIAKKEAIKMGAMQQLLTGRIRLPQFAKREDGTPKGYKTSELGEIPEDWEVVSLFDLANHQKELFDDGDWIEAKYITDKGVRLIQTGNIGVGSYVEKSDKKYISENSFSQLKCKKLKIRDILICRLAEPAGRACLFLGLSDENVITSVDVTIFRPLSHISREFYVQYFSTPEWFKAVSQHVGGTTHKRISRGSLAKILVPLPKEEEQKIIAEIFVDMDSELEALEKRLDKTKALKQGMMQELLTGRTRLV